MDRLLSLVSQCNEGDIVVDDIFSYDGVFLVAKDTILNNYIIKRLEEMGIKNIYIYAREMNCSVGETGKLLKLSRSYRESVLAIRQIIEGISCGGKLDYKKVERVSELIYNNLDERAYITKCMNVIRRADEYTYYHCINTAFYSMMMGKWLVLSEREIQILILSGLLHDIGKVKIPKEILNKKGSLTAEEFEIIKHHPVFGYDILNEIGEIDPEVKIAVLMHHERLDGSGYPFNASSDKVGLYAKIVAIADVYDAMTSERVYKKRATPFETFEMFITTGMEKFDVSILNTFLKNISRYYVGTNVVLTNRKVGKIVYIPPHDILSPIVETAEGCLDLSQKGSPKVLEMQ